MPLCLARPLLPAPRGPLSEVLIDALRRSAGPLAAPEPAGADPLTDEDLQLALYCMYELHYRGFDGVDERWEWSAPLLGMRARLEAPFEQALRERVPVPALTPREALLSLMTGGGPSLSQFVELEATLQHLRELCIHRSLYQLKEADPHTWGIPRLHGDAKAAMVEVQMDEYGCGVETDMHSSLFADTMRSLGLDTAYGAYLDVVPATTLATVNLVTMFGLHRRWRGALVGHLALFEMTSTGPMGRYSRALERLGLRPAARRFYDVHVEADARHEVIALERMVGALVADEPHLAHDVIFGAAALSAVEAAFTRHVLDAWNNEQTSLRSPGPAHEVALSAYGAMTHSSHSPVILNPSRS